MKNAQIQKALLLPDNVKLIIEYNPTVMKQIPRINLNHQQPNVKQKL